jgi:hypothetical protein
MIFFSENKEFILENFDCEKKIISLNFEDQEVFEF